MAETSIEHMEEDRNGKNDIEDQVGEEKELINKKQYSLPSLPTVIIMPTKRPMTGNGYNCHPTHPSILQPSHLLTSYKSDIQLAESDCPHHDQDPEPGPECQVVRLSSLKKLCGMRTGNILAVSATVISVWITWIVIIHLNSKIDQLTAIVEETNENIKIMKEVHLDFRAQYDRNDRIGQRSLNKALHKIGQGFDALEHNIQDKDEETQEEAASEEVLTLPCTASGSPCVLPFLYQDKVWTDCVQQWTDRRPWCATTVTLGGQFVDSGDDWDYCVQC